MEVVEKHANSVHVSLGHKATPPSQNSSPGSDWDYAQPTGPWSRSRRPSQACVGTLKEPVASAPRRRPFWSRSAARRTRVDLRHADDTVKQEVVERVDRSTARRMLACVRVMDPEQLSAWP